MDKVITHRRLVKMPSGHRNVTVNLTLDITQEELEVLAVSRIMHRFELALFRAGTCDDMEGIRASSFVHCEEEVVFDFTEHLEAIASIRRARKTSELLQAISGITPEERTRILETLQGM